jgi:phosphatidylserine/phosphatidylglycerophosphate/cardiolipin synthase-like enzyme
MYDFTSGPILAEFIADLTGRKTLQMVLDNPAPNDTRDQLDGITVEELNSKLSSRAKIARALVRTDKFATNWMFPYAYHIKVIVQDGVAFWLSSGNLNNSNQPDSSRPPHKEDRDWHVIIENEELATTFSYYLDYDYDSAIQYQTPNPDEIEKAIEDALAKKGEQTNPSPSQPAPPVKNPTPAKTFTNVDATITPLLTPDKLPDGQPQYLTNITNLISQAKESIYIQLQYIEASKGDGSTYEKLLQTIADKIAEGVKVSLIEDGTYGLKWAEKMKAAGVDLTANIFLQSKDYSVHNKGFIIDSKIAVVSSQNFSPAGVETNRDAGVIIENEDVAKYFEAVFLQDLKNRTRPALTASASRNARAEGAATQKGSARSKSSPGAARKAKSSRKA